MIKNKLKRGCTPQSSRFDHPEYIRRTAQTMELLSIFSLFQVNVTIFPYFRSDYWKPFGLTLKLVLLMFLIYTMYEHGFFEFLNP